ncbi:hypothetical protein GGI25_004999 [Coemansia spiralis]|uniref:DUF3074 domain-containing protein n=2 Tax=Coemansia TaxID=4863 RepID=A0A9W8G419_9FUNG|nr:hypothetical protein BX070DRAFT_234375 [Coemansia spiralis]KAJ1989185.1 hypothetical protein EDC05_004841 [Coemansia umbellata]KAJ2620139.1 hypothetical protein GGI26_005254 [Coemansia sp. RSA 1358]KAJ2672681.1 hypothetical protein GGI25_004999 [Coemansia spiralis]
MVLKPIKRSIVPSPLEDQRGFDDFVTQYLNKCDDLISYTRRYPVVRENGRVRVQRQNRNPHEDHRWLRRDVATEASYDELKSVLFVNRADHQPRWMPQMASCERIEPIVPGLCEVFRLSFRSSGLKAKRDYCQLVVKREFLGEHARPKPRLFTPSASMASLALQSSVNLAEPTSPTGDSRFAGLGSTERSSEDNSVPVRPIRRFQVVTIPMLHSSCTPQRGHVRAFFESYEEVREYPDGHVEWTCIHHSDFAGWVPSVLADHSIATAFPKEADALLDYVLRARPA